MTKRMTLSFTLTVIYDHVVQVEMSDVVVFLCEFKDRLGTFSASIMFTV